MGRGKGYFDKLLNGDNIWFVFEDVVPNDGLTQLVGRNEVLKSNVITNEEGETTEMDVILEDV